MFYDMKRIHLLVMNANLVPDLVKLIIHGDSQSNIFDNYLTLTVDYLV